MDTKDIKELIKEGEGQELEFKRSLAERKEILESIKYVDESVPCIDTDQSVAKTLEQLRPKIFAKGGDRTKNSMPKNEIDVCRNLGI